MKPFVATVFAWLLTLAFWAWTVAKILMDWVGRSTVIEDWQQLQDRMPDMISLVLDTPSWVPAACAFLLTFATLWFMWKTQNHTSVSPSPKTGNTSWKNPLRLLKASKPIDAIPAIAPNDFDLILRPEQPVVAQAKRTDDGIDLLVRIVVRNRSKTPLWIDVVEQFPMTFDGQESDRLSGGATRPFRPEANNASIFGEIRAYHGVAGRVGNGRISYLFGKDEAGARWIFDVDVDFRILEDPTKKDVQETVPERN